MENDGLLAEVFMSKNVRDLRSFVSSENCWEEPERTSCFARVVGRPIGHDETLMGAVGVREWNSRILGILLKSLYVQHTFMQFTMIKIIFSTSVTAFEKKKHHIFKTQHAKYREIQLPLTTNPSSPAAKVDGSKFSTLCLLVILANVPRRVKQTSFRETGEVKEGSGQGL